MRSFVAAAVQFAVEPMDVEENLSRAEMWVDRCVKESQAELVVLPESFTTGFTPLGDAKDLWDAVSEIPGPLTDRGVQWAKKMGIHLVFPTYERGPERGVVYNSAVLIGPSGILGVYRKTHPFPTERLEGGGWTTPGHEPFCVKTELGNIGIVICYDGDFPELARVTTLMGAEVICRPSAFMRTFDHWEITNRARAYDNHVYWVATNSVGRDASGAYFFGGSMIVHPSAMKLAQARASDECVWARLDPDPIRRVLPNSSAEQWFDHVEDRNLRSYRGILEEGRCPFEPARRIPYGR
ncbi:putative amidohydrolase [Thermanaerovibrio velox DSM 12556]|uniref:Putative amidohydrolase n=1 Tax=Thermanaerovibrio velox DSM 12556 TaxID=926567 RepID=H0UP13_9BACT|nr:carbon-nitrogen hydrolase family protein [Thermanaerovibrio velox]EHM10516.1 putative amidohydrolase [Thermanaerovibrio velox DSM 12556]